MGILQVEHGEWLLCLPPGIFLLMWIEPRLFQTAGGFHSLSHCEALRSQADAGMISPRRLCHWEVQEGMWGRMGRLGVSPEIPAWEVGDRSIVA